jgi:hypothetical protein
MPTVESRIAAMAPTVCEMDVMKWLLAALGTLFRQCLKIGDNLSWHRFAFED